ncbi:hypothetical protein HIM_00185 [Hirsutella minnesotensis 3608]|nr:hypothetical protein HIM_00185 [Hirsutella minnesotensis 3608]
MPRYMFLLKSDSSYIDSHGHEIPTHHLDAFIRFNEEIAKAGVLLLADGFQHTADGYRLKYDASTKHEVVEGPLDISKEDHLGAFWLILLRRRSGLGCPVKIKTLIHAVA